jgi:hypothetical protein
MTDTRALPKIATSTGHTFICYARQDEAFVLEVAESLRRRGVPIWIDRFNIEPGADWGNSIDTALNACATFLIVLSPQAVTSEEVRGELRVALDSGKRIIPLLYQSCEIPGRLRLRQYVDFTRSPRVSDASLNRLAEVLLGTGNKQFTPTPDQDRRSRQMLLADLKAEAADRLRSIGTDRLVPVLLDREPHQVARPWDHEGGVPIRPRAGPPVTDVVAVFDDEGVGGHLLILGAPGSGKTTVMLQLLQQLVARADAHDGFAMPVLVSLASWKNDRTIGEWLVDELKVKYGLRADHGMRWRDGHRLAPLLDGLDELPAERQEACVEAINDFQQAYRPPFLVVCCRRGEYENFTVKLRLREAVGLRPLEPGQIRAYLDHAGTSDLWSALQADPELIEMARSPLLLSFMSELPHQPDAQRWQNAPSAAERRRRLFDSYVSSRLSIAATRPAYSREQTLGCLRQLATILKRQGLSEFLVERMQPGWLESPVQRWSYRAGVLMIGATTVVLVQASLMWLFGSIPPGTVGVRLQESDVVAMIGQGSPADRGILVLLAIIIGSVVASRRTIVPIETLTWSWPRAWINMRRWAKTAALAGLDYGIPIGVLIGLLLSVMTYEAGGGTVWEKAGMLLGSAGGLMAAVFLARVKPSAWSPYAEGSVTRPRILHALTAAGLYALVAIAGWSLVSSSEPLAIVPLVAADVVATLGVFAVIGLSPLSRGRSLTLLRTSVVGVIAGATAGALSWTAVSTPAPFRVWWIYWMTGGLIVGVIAGLIVSLGARVEVWWRSNQTPIPAGTDRSWWMRTAATGVLIGISLAVASTAGARLTSDRLITDVLVSGVFLEVGFEQLLIATVLSAIAMAIGAAPTAGVLGGLAGVLSGATGADVERRLIPNQGIRQSARNVVLFAALGGLIVGVPYGLLNLAVGILAVGALPSTADWLRLGVGAGLGFGLLAGLLPGAACIQHFVLRFVLWASRSLPLRWVSFLNFATHRRLLQRVGGRYRFIHVLLRDHLGEVSPGAKAP